MKGGKFMKKKLPLLFLASALLFSACTAPAATPSGEGQQEGGEGQGGGRGDQCPQR